MTLRRLCLLPGSLAGCTSLSLCLLCVLPAGSLAGCTLEIDPTDMTHEIPRLHRGCHSDSGFAHNARGLSAELVHGCNFQRVPDGAVTEDSSQIGEDRQGGVRITPGWQLSGPATLSNMSGHGLLPSLLVNGGQTLLLRPGASAANRGFGAEGLHLQERKPYDGLLFAWSAAPQSLTLSLESWNAEGVQATIATTVVHVPGNSTWSKLPFVLTPTQAAPCTAIPNADALARFNISCPPNNTYTGDGIRGGLSDASSHICVHCGGQLTISWPSSAAVLSNHSAKAHTAVVGVGYCSLMAGLWGRFAGLPVRADSAAMLQRMGTTMIRQGGTFVKTGGYPWTVYRGPRWQRSILATASAGNWFHSTLTDFGIFEMIDLCNALEIEPVITLCVCGLQPQSFADLVEYAWGGLNTTFGKLRASDGHPLPYRVKWFELGNEEYNPHFGEQVAAMEAKAASLGMPKTLYYMFPGGGPKPEDAGNLSALELGDHLVSDIHSSATGATKTALPLLSATNGTMVGWGVINCETNCGEHATHRMLEEATDLNAFFQFNNTRLLGRAASFCLERSGYNEGGLNDQGIAFFLPNMSWLQPPGWVHAVVADTYQPINLDFTLSCDTNDSMAPPRQRDTHRERRRERYTKRQRESPPVSSVSVQRSAPAGVGGVVVIRAVGLTDGNLTIRLVEKRRNGAKGAAAAVLLEEVNETALMNWGCQTDLHNPRDFHCLAEANTPSEPMRVSPRMRPRLALRTADSVEVNVTKNSYAVWELRWH